MFRCELEFQSAQIFFELLPYRCCNNQIKIEKKRKTFTLDRNAVCFETDTTINSMLKRQGGKVLCIFKYANNVCNSPYRFVFNCQTKFIMLSSVQLSNKQSILCSEMQCAIMLSLFTVDGNSIERSIFENHCVKPDLSQLHANFTDLQRNAKYQTDKGFSMLKRFDLYF